MIYLFSATDATISIVIRGPPIPAAFFVCVLGGEFALQSPTYAATYKHHA